MLIKTHVLVDEKRFWKSDYFEMSSQLDVLTDISYTFHEIACFGVSMKVGNPGEMNMGIRFLRKY